MPIVRPPADVFESLNGARAPPVHNRAHAHMALRASRRSSRVPRSRLPNQCNPCLVPPCAALEELMRVTLGALANFNEDEKMLLLK